MASEPSPELVFLAQTPDLAKRFAGQHIAIVGEEVFAGKTPREAYEKARNKHPGETPLLTYIPEGEAFIF